MTPADPRFPTDLAAARQRCEHWRSTRSKPYRIPAPLWTAAVRCATKYGVYRTCRALGLDYNCLKRRVMAVAAPPIAPATFVELLPAGPNGAAECVVEVERPGGAKLRIELRGRGIPDLADLARRFAVEGA